MPEAHVKRLSVCVVCLLLAGCGVKARNYVMIKDRVDQEMYGNAGTLFGDPQPRGEYRKTRKVYVLELTDPAEEDPMMVDDILASDVNLDQPLVIEKRTPSSSRRVVMPEPIKIPKIDDEDLDLEHYNEAPSRSYTKSAEYVVEKGDTLQKISKKFYGGYSKWPRIYDANRGLLKDPNSLKVGMKLVVPLDE